MTFYIFGIKINPVIKINSKGENVLEHTAPFPIEIPEFAVQMYSYPGEIVMDPFAGSFTSVIAANRLGRIGLGIELNKQMFAKSSRQNLRKNLENKKISECNYEQRK